MSETSSNLDLPYLQAAQAQKHLTHNAALERLDVIVQLVVQAFGATTPPLAPDEGQVWALGPGAVNDWAGHDGALAAWANGGWLFITPRIGWRAAMGTASRSWDGTDWVQPDVSSTQNLPGVGIGTTSDATNRLAVASDAALFTHAGAGHQVKLNKATAGDTASLLYQTDWSGRAEMGLAGSDDWSIKVSPDGSTWVTALVADRLSGAIELGVPLALASGGTGAQTAAAARANLGLGTAATATLTTSPLDITPGRVLMTGAFGFGGATPPNCANLDDQTVPTGLYRTTDAITLAGTWPPSNPTGFGRAGQLLVVRSDGGSLNQIWWSLGEDSVWRRRYVGGWGPWRRMTTVLGTVTQSGGHATGALFQTGSTGSGRFQRDASGELVCRHTLTSDAGGATTWTYPSAFVEEPVVVATPIASDGVCATLDGAPGTGSVTVSAWSLATGLRVAVPVQLRAEGRWSTMA